MTLYAIICADGALHDEGCWACSGNSVFSAEEAVAGKAAYADTEAGRRFDRRHGGSCGPHRVVRFVEAAEAKEAA